MNIGAYDCTLRHIATFETDIEALEDLDPLFAQQRVRVLSGYGNDSPNVEELTFYELKKGIRFEKHVDYSVYEE